MQSELSDFTVKSLFKSNMIRMRAEVNAVLSTQKVCSAAEDQSMSETRLEMLKIDD